MKQQKNKTPSLKYLYNTRMFMLWAVFIGFLLFLLITVAIIPQITRSMDLYETLISENKKLAQLKIKDTQLTEAQSSILLINQDLINSTLPSKKPLLELLTGFNYVAGQSQVSLSNISLSPGSISTESATTTTQKKTASKQKYDELKLDLSVVGPIENVNQFLKDIEQLAPFTTVIDLSLNETSKNSSNSFDGPMFEAKLTVSSYFFTRSVSAGISTAIPEVNLKQRETLSSLQDFIIPGFEIQGEIRGGGLEDLFKTDQVSSEIRDQINLEVQN